MLRSRQFYSFLDESNHQILCFILLLLRRTTSRVAINFFSKIWKDASYDILIVSTCIPECYRNFNGTSGKNDYREIPSPRRRIRIAYEFIMAIRGSLRIAGAKISTNVRIHDTESYKLPDGFRYPWDFPTILSWSLRNFSLKWHSEVFYYIRQPRRAIQVYI